MYKIGRYNPNLDNTDYLNKKVKFAYEKCKDFFGREPEKIEVNFVYSRNEMNKITGRQTPEWLVGVSGANGLAIFSPSLFSKVSTHPSKDFLPVLTHEVAHVFTNNLFGIKEPLWLKEGIAGYVAGQNIKINKNKLLELDQLHDRDGWDKHPNYPEAYSFTNYLIGNNGKAMLLRLIAKLDEKEGYQSFSVKFYEIFKKSLKSVYAGWAGHSLKRSPLLSIDRPKIV